MRLGLTLGRRLKAEAMPWQGAPRRRGAMAGFTLIEIVASVLLLGVALIAVLPASIHAMRILQQNKRALLARVAVHRQLESLRSQGYVSVASMASPTSFTDPAIPDGQGRIFVTDYNGDPRVKQLTVTLTLDAERVWRLVSLVTQP